MDKRKMYPIEGFGRLTEKRSYSSFGRKVWLVGLLFTCASVQWYLRRVCLLYMLVLKTIVSIHVQL